MYSTTKHTKTLIPINVITLIFKISGANFHGKYKLIIDIVKHLGGGGVKIIFIVGNDFHQTIIIRGGEKNNSVGRDAKRIQLGGVQI